jgi:hypothetical protein
MNRLHTLLLVITYACSSAVIGVAQSTTPAQQVVGSENPHVQQVSRILGVEAAVKHLRELQSSRPCGVPAGIEELSVRQDLSEAALAASLDVDSVEGEIANERAQLMEVRTVLGNRRDHAINLMGVANLVTGTGVGILVNAMQFSDSTAILGDGIGVGSGIGSTVLSILGIHKQAGSKVALGHVPNMLAPLFDRPAVLNTSYPPSVRSYLDSERPNVDGSTLTRLQDLKIGWENAGHMPVATDKSYANHLTLMTTSESPKVKVSIGDLSDRIAMLNDVSGRAGLMKRDLALLMRLLIGTRTCGYRVPAQLAPDM